MRSQVLESLSLIDRAIEDFTVVANELKTAVAVACEEQLSQLLEARGLLNRELPLALAEVEATLEEDQPQLTTLYAPLIRDLIEQPRDFYLFTHKKEASAVTVPFDFYFPQPDQLIPPEHFPAVFGKTIKRYNAKTLKYTKHTLAVDFGKGGSFLLLNRDSLLCLGGPQPTREAYILDLPTCQLRTIQALFEARAACGIGKTEKSVYVFGGIDATTSYMKSSETWSPQANQWRRLPKMCCSHAYFTPTLFRFKFYLVSAGNLLDDCPVETFNTSTEKYTSLRVLLPSKFDSAEVVSFVNRGEICVLSNKEVMARWEVETEQQMRLYELSLWCSSTQQPLIVGKVVLIACKEQILSFSLDSYSFL